jgi:hypothetical protein
MRVSDFVTQIYGECVGDKKLGVEFDFDVNEGPLLPWSFVETTDASWAVRLSLAINLTRTLAFVNAQPAVICSLHKQQVCVGLGVLRLDNLR